MQTKDTAALLVCAGNASRMGGINKILHPLGDETVLLCGLRRFCLCESIAELIIVCRPQDEAAFRSELKKAELPLPVQLVNGGETRQQSVKNGFAACSENAVYLAIHDGARPLIRPADIELVIQEARKTGAATLGVPVKDTIKTVHDGIIVDTPNRASLWQTQTPQVFEKNVYAQALALAEREHKDYTDDCQLVEALGRKVTMTRGDYANIKLTTPEDFAVAEALLAAQKGELQDG